jgi:hypothetical protein
MVLNSPQLIKLRFPCSLKPFFKLKFSELALQ